MADYEIVVFCDDCGQVHTLGGLVVSLDDGPAEPSRIGDLYAGKSVPPQIADMLSLKVHCEGRDKNFVMRDVQKQSFLVACKRSEVVGRTFFKEDVILDNRDFRECSFDQSRIIITGAASFGMYSCIFHLCQFVFGGAAARTFAIIEAMRTGLPDMYKQVLDAIQTGKVGQLPTKR